MSEQTSDRSWIWLLALFTLAVLADAAFYGHAAAFTPLHLAALGLSEQEVVTYTGVIASLSFAVGIPFLPLWGALADRYTRQPVITRSFAAFLIAGALMALGRNVWVFGVGRAVMSFALGNTGLMLTTLGERTPPNRIGLAFAVMNSAAPLGYFSGTLIGGPLVDRFGLPTVVMIDCAAILLVILLLTFGYRDTYRGVNRGSVVRMAVDSVVIAWKSARLRWLFLAMFVLFGGWQVALPYIPLVTTSIYTGDNPGQAVGLVAGLGGVAGMLIGPALGALSDRYGRWRVLFIGAGLSAALLPLPLLARSLEGLIVTWGIANGVLAGVFAMSFSVLSDSAADDIRGRVMAFAYLPVNLGSVMGPAIAALVAVNEVRMVFPAAAVIVALGIGVLWIAARVARAVPAEAAA